MDSIFCAIQSAVLLFATPASRSMLGSKKRYWTRFVLILNPTMCDNVTSLNWWWWTILTKCREEAVQGNTAHCSDWSSRPYTGLWLARPPVVRQPRPLPGLVPAASQHNTGPGPGNLGNSQPWPSVTPGHEDGPAVSQDHPHIQQTWRRKLQEQPLASLSGTSKSQQTGRIF